MLKHIKAQRESLGLKRNKVLISEEEACGACGVHIFQVIVWLNAKSITQSLQCNMF